MTNRHPWYCMHKSTLRLQIIRKLCVFDPWRVRAKTGQRGLGVATSRHDLAWIVFSNSSACPLPLFTVPQHICTVAYNIFQLQAPSRNLTHSRNNALHLRPCLSFVLWDDTSGFLHYPFLLLFQSRKIICRQLVGKQMITHTIMHFKIVLFTLFRHQLDNSVIIYHFTNNLPPHWD